MAKRFSPRGLSKHQSYTIEEAAQIIGASKQTLRHWGSNGDLEIMTSCRPHIVHGSVLIACLQAKTPKRKPPPLPGQFDCWSCRARVMPFGLMADYTPISTATGLLSALCEQCEGDLSTIVGAKKLTQYSAVLEIAMNDE